MGNFVKYADGTCYHNVLDEGGSQSEKVPCSFADANTEKAPTGTSSYSLASAWNTLSAWAESLGKSIATANQPKITRYSDGTCYASEVDEFGRHSWKAPCE